MNTGRDRMERGGSASILLTIFIIMGIAIRERENLPDLTRNSRLCQLVQRRESDIIKHLLLLRSLAAHVAGQEVIVGCKR